MIELWNITAARIGFDPAGVVERGHGLAGAYPGYGSVEARLAELLALPSGWDGYRGVATTAVVARRVHELLHASLSVDARLPSIVPGASGDVQLEWHLEGIDLEVGVSEEPAVEIRLWTPDTGDNGFETVIEMRDVPEDGTCVCGHGASEAAERDLRGARSVLRMAKGRDAPKPDGGN